MDQLLALLAKSAKQVTFLSGLAVKLEKFQQILKIVPNSKMTKMLAKNVQRGI